MQWGDLPGVEEVEAKCPSSKIYLYGRVHGFDHSFIPALLSSFRAIRRMVRMREGGREGGREGRECALTDVCF